VTAIAAFIAAPRNPVSDVVMMLSGPADAEVTVTPAEALTTFGALVLAVIMSYPSATPVTGTFALVAPALKVTVDGTVAMAVFCELRLTVRPPAGAGAESARFRFRAWEEPAATLPTLGWKARLAPTLTDWLAEVYPVAVAVIVVVPYARPVTNG
jgi:hypothetical protein